MKDADSKPYYYDKSGCFADKKPDIAEFMLGTELMGLFCMQIK